MAALLVSCGASAQTQMITYKCGNEATIRVDTKAKVIIWMNPDGSQEIHAAIIDADSILWDMRSAHPMRIDRHTGAAQRWASDKWESAGLVCSIQKEKWSW